MSKPQSKLNLGDLRIGEVEMLLKGLDALSPEDKKNVVHSNLLKKVKSLQAGWERTETVRKNTRQNALKSIKSKAFK